MKSYNQQIVAHIRHYMQQAQHRIWVNVPWFTHKELYETLYNKAARGISVQIIIQDDEINRQTSFRHEDIAIHGGKVYRFRTDTPGSINHEKYCLIDDQYIIYGSFNWTYNADQNNLESILVGEKPNEEDLIKYFEKRFTDVLRLYFTSEPTPDATLPTDMNYMYKLEITLLQQECSWLEAEIHELETAYQNIEKYIVLHTGDLMLEKLNLEVLLKEKEAELMNKKIYEENYSQKKKEYDEIKQQFENYQKQSDVIEQKAKEKKNQEIKQLYRELVKMIHPDKFAQNPELYEKANRLMARINMAYENNDMDELQKIQALIENGIFASEDIFKQEHTSSNLQRMLAFWKNRKTELLQKLTELKNRDFYRIFTNEISLDDYVYQLKTQLELHINTLKENLKNYPL